MSPFKKIRKCVYDRIAYIIKKVSIFFQKRGFKGGGTILPRGQQFFFGS